MGTSKLSPELDIFIEESKKDPVVIELSQKILKKLHDCGVWMLLSELREPLGLAKDCTFEEMCNFAVAAMLLEDQGLAKLLWMVVSSTGELLVSDRDPGVCLQFSVTKEQAGEKVNCFQAICATTSLA